MNVARRRNQAVETLKKFTGGTNKSAHTGPANAARIDADNISTKVATVSASFSRALQQARCERKLTQAQLAQRVNEKQSLIKAYEDGTAIPNGQIENKLRRELGVNLPPARVKEQHVEEDAAA